MKNVLIALAFLVVLGVFTVLLKPASEPNTLPSAGSVAGATPIGAATTSAAVAVTSSTRVLASSTQPGGATYNRVFATICNPTTTLVYLNFNNDRPALLGKYTAIIAAAAGYSACYEINDRNIYQGSVQASSTNETSVSVQVSDYVQ